MPAWADAWLRTEGIDTLTPTASPAPGGWRLEVTHTGSRPHRVAVGLYDRAVTEPGQLVLRDRITLDVTATAAVERRELPGPRPDLILLNDGDLSYVKVRYDEHSWESLTDALGSLPDPLSRAVAWNAARDLVRDARIAPADHLALVRRHLRAETDPAIVEGVLGFARNEIADRYLAPELRADALAALAETARTLLAAGHDAIRLAATRTLVSTATGADGAALLRGWYDRGEIPGGSALDPELRWRLLLRLCVLDAAGAADIDAELDRDPSATGREGAARCRAALPDAAAKAAAWESLFHDDTLSNYLFTATAQGFWQPEQPELADEYVPRFYPDALDVSARRGPAIADAIGRHLFPNCVVTAESLDLGRRTLATATPTPAILRALTDRLDDLTRALRIRTAFGA